MSYWGQLGELAAFVAETQILRPPEIRTTFKGKPLERNRPMAKPMKEDSKADKAMDKKMGIKEGSKRDQPEKKGKK